MKKEARINVNEWVRQENTLKARRHLVNLSLAIVPSFFHQYKDALWLFPQDEYSLFTVEAFFPQLASCNIRAIKKLFYGLCNVCNVLH